jgi:LuxR family maltose regulon positive regulatory protein
MIERKLRFKAYNEPTYTLTSREFEILGLLRSGLKRPKIAEKLSLSTYTINTHLKRIHSKMDAHSDIELVSRAMKERIL